jgi:hypothetical protein
VFAEKVPAGDGWLHELKHDGFPIIVVQRTVTTFAGGSGIAKVDVDPAGVVRAPGRRLGRRPLYHDRSHDREEPKNEWGPAMLMSYGGV